MSQGVDDGTYVLLTRSRSRVGRFVRAVTRSGFNHASVVVVVEGRAAVYSFARRLHSTPFYSGMVREGIDRIRANVGDRGGRVRLLRVRYADPREVEQRILGMYLQAQDYEYNSFDAVASVFRVSVGIPQAATCVTFVPTSLGQDTDGFHTISDLEAQLPSDHVLDGTFEEFVRLLPAQVESGDPEYWNEVSIARNVALTAANLARLTGRLIRPGERDRDDSALAARVG